MQLKHFKVTKFRNIWDSGWIAVDRITAFVGQNEAGKSNLFEALCQINPIMPGDSYHIDEDWPVDDWGNKDPSAVVCEAKFALDATDLAALHAEAGTAPLRDPGPAGEELMLYAQRSYDGPPRFALQGSRAEDFDAAKVEAWARVQAPKFVYIHDYALTGTQIELHQLAERYRTLDWNDLTNEEQTIKIVLDLAKIDIGDFLTKGQSPAGRTSRSFDKRAASSYLSKQFRDLWTQKKVNFHVEIDGTTLNIFAEDEAIGLPVRLHRRSSGFRWHVSFAWKFTHASKGLYKGCVLLLEEPGIHLHHMGQRDLLDVFQRLSDTNTVLYTTHLSSMLDTAYPERVRIVETEGNHSTTRSGVVSAQRAPMAVIELALGLTGDMAGLLGSRQTLIIEGADEAVIMHKLSGILRGHGRIHLSDKIYLWPAQGALRSPMYAAFALGHRWDSGALLDSDPEGLAAKKRIDELILMEATTQKTSKFRTLLFGPSAGLRRNEAGIEDLFDDEFYLSCVNATFGVSIKEADLPSSGPEMITKRVEAVLLRRYGHDELDRRRVMSEILRRSDGWKKAPDLPRAVADRAEKLFSTINEAYSASSI